MRRNIIKYIWIAAALVLPLVLFLQYALAEEEKTVYITFDDGPTLNTPEILKTLEKYGAKATFFLLEERIVMYPDFTKEIYHSKNAIGLHGVSHSEAIYSSPTSPLEEMKKAEKSLKSVIGVGSKLVRVPFGSSYRLSDSMAKNLTDNGYLIWDWNVDPRDSVGTIVPEKVLKNLKKDLSRCKGTPVILLHDRKSTANLLPVILEYLKNEGYKMMPLSELDTPVNHLR